MDVQQRSTCVAVRCLFHARYAIRNANEAPYQVLDIQI